MFFQALQTNYPFIRTCPNNAIKDCCWGSQNLVIYI